LIGTFSGSLSKVLTTARLGDVERMEDGTLVVPIVVEDMTGVLAGELELVVRGRSVPVHVVQGEGVDGYVFANRVEGDIVRIAFAGVRSDEGVGRVAELHFDPTEGVVGEVELMNVWLNGDRMVLGQRVVQVSDRPGEYVLRQNYPNPFNPETVIRYDVAKLGVVRLSIYTLTGQPVRILVDGESGLGSYSVVWNGRDDEGREVSSGLYLCRMEAGDYSAVRKLMLVR